MESAVLWVRNIERRQMKIIASIVTLSLAVSAVGLGVGASLASETAMHKYSAAEVKNVCDKVGGECPVPLALWIFDF